jgi:hypothetical protein
MLVVTRKGAVQPASCPVRGGGVLDGTLAECDRADYAHKHRCHGVN